MKECPCKNCICMAICKQKEIRPINDCELVGKYVTRRIPEDKNKPPLYFISRWNRICEVLEKPMYKLNPDYF